jgi:DNA-binding response OmpR family regulator
MPNLDELAKTHGLAKQKHLATQSRSDFLRHHQTLQLEEEAMTDVHKILIVDDDRNIHGLIEAALARSGQYHFSHAYNGEEGVSFFEEHKPSLMLLDIDMPIMNGIQVLKKLALRVDNKCTIIVMSGLATGNEQNQCIELGAKMFMGKPFQIVALIKSINYFLNPSLPQ